MVIKELMSKEVACCTPWDTAKTAARLMKKRAVGAIPVVSDLADPLVEGVVTDRDLCCRVVAEGKDAATIQIWELMTPVPVTCEQQDSLEDCIESMQQNQVRRIPVVDKRGRCVGIVAQADLALRVPAVQFAKMVSEISKPSQPQRGIHLKKDYFYCSQLHEEDQILLLNRRRNVHREAEVLR